MILSTKTTTKFARKVKLNNLKLFIQEYSRICQVFVDMIWNIPKIPSKLPKNLTSQIQDSWLSARAIQCAGKQASGIVRGTRKKHQQRIWKLKQLQKQKENASKLQRKIDKTILTKPKLESVCPELDERFVKIDINNSTSFDGWLVLTSLGNKMKIKIPFKKTKHFNQLMEQGDMKLGCRISNSWVAFNFSLPKPGTKEQGKTIGIDIGLKDCWTASDSQVSQTDQNGWNLEQILFRLARRKKGSKGFQKTQNHRTNFINWSFNQLDLTNVGQINIEKIQNLRKGKRINRKLSSWTYTEIFDKLESVAERTGVLIHRINPTFTSQRCSECGWTRRVNRKGKAFCCRNCGLAVDADLNASRNIELGLATPWQERRDRKNIQGFFWNPPGQEQLAFHLKMVNDIVPDVQEEHLE